MKRWILVTGGAGYIGSVLVRKLLAEGHEVRVLDSLKFGAGALLEVAGHPRFELVKGDIRDKKTVKTAMQNVVSVIHLAAIVGDPASKLFPEETEEVNWKGSVNLWEQAHANGVKRFVFASTCSNYGVMGDEEHLVDENSQLSPQSLYAKTKVRFEEYLLDNLTFGNGTTILRFSTVYGYSPRMRFDLSVNHFCRDLFSGKELEVFGAGQWRPYCHVQDLAASVVKVLQQPLSAVAGKVYNIGDSQENYTKQEIVDRILAHIPNGKVTYPKKAISDTRDYRVDFSRARLELGFRISRGLESGIEEVIHALESGILGDPYAPNYSNT